MVAESFEPMIHLENALVKEDAGKLLFLNIGGMPVFTQMSGVSRHMES